jgi:FkbH-like protein
VNNTKVPHLVISCPSAPDGTESNREGLFSEWDQQLVQEFEADPHVSIITAVRLQALYPVRRIHDSYSDELALIPYTPAMYAAIGTVVARQFHMLTTAPYKAVVVDCDNTLWGGICSEDGARGVLIDKLHVMLQKFLVAQYERGVLLCLCSKNNEEDVHAVFRERKEMPLKMEHVALDRINWKPKPENLVSMAKELGLGVDSFIFLDDNPVECETMRLLLPDVLTLQLPSEIAEAADFLQRVWAFDRAEATKEDGERTASYKQTRERETLRQSSATLEQFLAGLELKVAFEPLNDSNLSRASQLTFRVNQFNFTALRRTEVELLELVRGGALDGLLVKVSDRFGDYGLVGLILYGWATDSLDVDTLLLSCRALGRGVEHRIISELAQMAKAKGLAGVSLRLAATLKNRPARDFLNMEFASYKRDCGEYDIYRIPVEIGRDLRPQAMGDNDRSVDPLDFSPAMPFNDQPQHATRSANLAWAAQTTTDGETILAAIETWKNNSHPGADDDIDVPRTELEQILANIWAEALALESVGIRKNFLLLGGDSLKMVQIIVRIYGRFGVEFPISTFFESQTIEEHAVKLAQLLPASRN